MSTSNNGNEEVKSTTIPHNLLVSKMKEIGQGDGNVSLILASQSPRRREILDMIGLKDRYTVIPSPLDESALQVELSLKVANQEMDPKEYTRILAEKKAQALGDALLQNKDDDKSSHPSSSCTTTLILGSDTIVDLNGKILEKPVDVDNAIHMITSLAGKWHEVHTGVAIYGLKDDTLELIESFTETARVKFANLTQNDIEAYVQTGEPMDKAGSYGIQGIGGQLVERLDGDFFTVMGLPMHTLSLALSRALST